MPDDHPPPLPWADFLRELSVAGTAIEAHSITASDGNGAPQDGTNEFDPPVDVTILAEAGTNYSCWYFACRSPRRHRHLRRELLAILGPSYSSYAGECTSPDVQRPLERLLMRQFGNRFIRVEVPSQFAEQAAERIALFKKLWRIAPPRSKPEPRLASRILADFEEALQHGDDKLAADCILSLRRDGLVDANNLLFLEVRRDEAFGRWSEVLSRIEHNRNALLSGIRPSRVHEALLRSVYAVSIAPFERLQNADDALAAFREQVLPHYSELLISRRNYRCKEAETLFALQWLDRLPIVDTDSFGPAVSPAAIPEWLQCLIPAEQAPAQEPAQEPEHAKRDLAAAQMALGRSDFDEAIDIAQHLDSSIECTKLLLAAYAVVGTLEVGAIILRHLHGLDTHEQQEIRSANAYASLLERLEPTREIDGEPAESNDAIAIPDGWVPWARTLKANPAWADASEFAADGAHQWEVGTLAAQGEELNEILGSLDATGNDRVLESLPYLLSSLLKVENVRPLANLLETLTILHLCDESPGEAFFPTLIDLTDLTLRAGTSSDQYRFFARETLTKIEEIAGPRDFNSLLDLLDTFCASGAPEPALRSALAAKIAELFGRSQHRISAGQKLLLEQLLPEAKCPLPDWLTAAPEVADDPRFQSPLERLGNRRIALYSLNERALKTVSDALRRAAPHAQVERFSDKAGGRPALKNAANTFDVFVIATAAATHAATGFIEQNRDSKKPTLRPAGKGSTSMIRELEQYASEYA